MNIIKTKTFTLRVHYAGLALLAFAACSGHGGTALLALAALVLHEGFHLLAILLLGVRIERIELTPFGGVADVESFQSLPTASQVCIALSGVLGSLLCYFALAWIPGVSVPLAEFRQMNLMLGIFNLLPILPLDGARALGAIADQFSCGRLIRKGMMGLAFLVSFVMIAAAAYGAWYGHINVTLVFVAPYLCYAARQAYVTQRMRLVEQALSMEAKLRRGAVMRVDGTACRQNATKPELLRMLLALPTAKLHYFFFLDPKTGEVKRVLEETEMIGEILAEKPKQ